MRPSINDMKTTYLVIVALATIIASSNRALALVVEKPLGVVEQKFQRPHEVVDVFLDAVGRGELVVFDRTIERSMLVPVSVEYVYTLGNAVPQVKVYSELNKPMVVPGRENCKVRGVSAVLDDDGRIVETEAHIWAE